MKFYKCEKMKRTCINVGEGFLYVDNFILPMSLVQDPRSELTKFCCFGDLVILFMSVRPKILKAGWRGQSGSCLGTWHMEYQWHLMVTKSPRVDRDFSNLCSDGPVSLDLVSLTRSHDVMMCPTLFKHIPSQHNSHTSPRLAVKKSIIKEKTACNYSLLC